VRRYVLGREERMGVRRKRGRKGLQEEVEREPPCPDTNIDLFTDTPFGANAMTVETTRYSGRTKRVWRVLSSLA
jgi:hypothetical protein